ncbi:hypothetical protein D5835_20285 [Salmonella enterica subsp. enterica serovar Aba]|nr:hypothetical protein [Salmonella enterica subsp. enterica serovar Aba]EBY6828001.1 hypothetical protein [Salmonella enterica subsp. enterica serovar Aba]
MEAINLSQARNLLLAAKSKAIIAREINDAIMLKEAQNSAVITMGRLFISSPFLAEVIVKSFGARGDI